MARTTDDPKQQRITVRVNGATIQRLKRLAREEGVTLGEVVRRLLVGEKTGRRPSRRK